MIVYNFQRVLKARGIERPFSYLKQAGFSDRFATRIKGNKVLRLNSRELEKICLLLRCTPNDLMEWVPDNNAQVDADHPLNIIRKSDKIIDLTKTLNAIPLGQLDEIEKLIQEKIQTNKTQYS